MSVKRKITDGLGGALHWLLIRRWKYTAGAGVVLLIAFWFMLPKQLFQDPTSVVVEDRNGNLMGARIAADGQWRFPYNDSVPEKFKIAITTFEDKRFFAHWGVDPVSMGRAMKQNLTNGRVVSGGSTLTMQVARLSRGMKSRSIWNKLVEAVLAFRIELSYSKDEILAMYASNAPFGGNVVGLDAAAWRYYGRNPYQLSWSEMATLAVLPNSPSLVHPGKNRDALRDKRNRLLDKLQEAGYLDSMSCELAKTEPLPGKPHILPNLAPHLTDRIQTEKGIRTDRFGDKRFHTTLDIHLQQRAQEIIRQHHYRLRGNQVHNAAAIIVEVGTGDVLAYVGNVESDDPEHHSQVDVIRSPRSTGSILKPFLYAAMMDEGRITPNTLVPDIPTYYGAYSPENYDQKYSGAVPAKRALARSLNIPAIRMLEKYSHYRFYDFLQKAGMTTLNRSADNYGLSLILGGAEAKLYDLAGIYASIARTVNEYEDLQGKYASNGFRAPNWDLEKSVLNGVDAKIQQEPPLIGAGAAYLTLQAMLEVTRPEDEAGWRGFSSARQIAWKTGTSYGFRDAWAIGATPDYVVAVWAGNADGEGRPGLVGVQAAAPILFDLFGLLPEKKSWFTTPYDDLIELPVCAQSGHRPLAYCEKIDTILATPGARENEGCPYHKLVHLDFTGQFRVHGDCESPMTMLHENWFILPPAQEEFYKRKNANYRVLPPFRADCMQELETQMSGRNMELIYPKSPTQIFVPRDLDGKISGTVFEVAHREKDTRIFWHLDEQYLGETENFHQMALHPPPGKHLLTLVDEHGEELVQHFEIIAGAEAGAAN